MKIFKNSLFQFSFPSSLPNWVLSMASLTHFELALGVFEFVGYIT